MWLVNIIFSFKELSFPGDNRLAESTSKAGNVQTYPEILCPENKLSKTVRVKGEKKESHFRLPLAKYKTIWVLKNKDKQLENIKYTKSNLQ